MHAIKFDKQSKQNIDMWITINEFQVQRYKWRGLMTMLKKEKEEEKKKCEKKENKNFNIT